MIKPLATLLLGAVLAGCGQSGRIGELPRIDSAAPSGKVVVVRISSVVGVANSYKVALDGNDLLNIRSGQHAEFHVPAGDHYIAVKCFGGWTPNWKEASLRFAAAPQQPSYFKISPNLSCAEIVPVAAEQAASLLAGSERIDLTASVK